jgi:hypothetical protein
MNALLESVSLARFKQTLGTAEDRAIFTAALNEHAELEKLAKDALYPSRLPALRARLKELGIAIDAGLEDLVFEQQREAARPELSALIARVRQPRFLAKVTPALAALDRKLFLLIGSEAVATEKAERKLYAPWGIDFAVPPLTRAIHGILQTNAKDSAERGPARYFNFTGEDPVAILNEWFSTPLVLDTF